MKAAISMAVTQMMDNWKLLALSFKGITMKIKITVFLLF